MMTRTVCNALRAAIISLICMAQCSAYGIAPDGIHQRKPHVADVAGSIDSQGHAPILELNDDNYQSIFRGTKPFLIKTYAPWCGPCKLIEPIIEDFAIVHKESLTVCAYNVEEKCPNLKLELLMNDVLPQSLPTLILFHGSSNVGKDRALAAVVHKGVIDRQGLEDFVDGHLVQTVSRSSNRKSDGQTQTQTNKGNGFVSLVQQADDYMLSPE